MDIADLQNVAAMDRAVAAAKLASELVGRDESAMLPQIVAALAAAERRALEQAIDLLRTLADMQTENMQKRLFQFAAFNVRNLIPPD